MHIPDTVLERLIFNINDKGILNFIPVLSFVQNPIRDSHPAFQLRHWIRKPYLNIDKKLL